MGIQRMSWRALLALLLVVASVGPLSATSYVMVTDEALVDGAPLAVVGRVTSVDRSVVAKGGRGDLLVTEYVVEVEETLKGDAPRGALKVRIPGGKMPNGIGYKVYGAPQFKQGERALLFLEPDGRGGFRPAHFLLGAFHEVPAGEHTLAFRRLGEASEVRMTSTGAEATPGSDRLRDFAAFSRWVAARAAGRQPEADYLVADPEGRLRQIAGKYTLFEDSDGSNLRWFEFDTAGDVDWVANKAGQAGVSGGGFAEFQAALQAWNADPSTPIDYHYGGKTNTTNSIGSISLPNEFDGINAIVFNDPKGVLPSFSCASGGVLAAGGPWYGFETELFRGIPYYPILGADIVTNAGISCFFGASGDASKAAQELFGHELGHTLGMGHSCGDSDTPDPGCNNALFDDALMRAFIHDDERGARLNNDDRAAIKELYSQIPAPPAGLTATPQSTTEIRLTWTDTATGETGFQIETKLFGGTFALVATAPANSTSFVVSGLQPATGYVFRIRAASENGESGYSNEASAATLAPVTPCVADSQTLCLNGNRFKAGVRWKTTDGQTGAATKVAVPSADSGLLWFFNPDNWEMLVKALDGCALNQHFWVFFAATTDVEYTLTVVDTQTGRVKVYFNPSGTPSPAMTDTQAFTCQ